MENHGNLHLRHDRDVDDMPRTLRTWRCTRTGMSTWSKNCTPNLSLHANGVSPPGPRTATVELHGQHCLDHNPCLAQQRARHQNTTCTRSKKRSHRNPATATPRPPPTPFTRAWLKNSSLGSFMMNSAGASTPEPVRPPTTRGRPCRATSLAPREVGGKPRRSR